MDIDSNLIINNLRDYKNFSTDTELANFLGVSKQNISAWRTRNSISVDKIISKMPEIRRNWLLTGEGEMLRDTLVIQKNKKGNNNYNSGNTTNIYGNDCNSNKDRIFDIEDGNQDTTSSLIQMLNEKDKRIFWLMEKLDECLEMIKQKDTMITQLISDKKWD